MKYIKKELSKAVGFCIVCSSVCYNNCGRVCLIDNIVEPEPTAEIEE